jgi:O-antigen ligase
LTRDDAPAPFRHARLEVVTPPLVATVVFGFGILGLFLLDRDKSQPTSKALWIPVLWMTLAVSTDWWAPVPANVNKFVEANPLERDVFAGLLAISCIVLFLRGKRVVTLLRANAPILLFFFYCALSLLWSDYPDVGFKRLIKALGDVAVVMIVLTDPNPRVAIMRFLARPCFFLIPVSVLLIKYYSLWGQRYNFADGVSEYNGITNSKNALGVLCLVFGVGAVWRVVRLFQERRLRPLVVHAVMLVMTLFLFWKCNSVTSIACFLMATTLIVWTAVPSLARHRVLLHTVVASFLTLAFVTLFLNLGSDLIVSMGRSATLTGRTELWDNLRGMNPSQFFGAGFESFWLGPRLARLWSVMAWRPNEAHNGYIEVYLNLGWVGLTLLAVVITTAYRNALRLLRTDRSEAGLMLAYIVISVAYSFTEAGFRMMGPMWIFLLFATIAVSQRPAGRTSEAKAVVNPGVTQYRLPAKQRLLINSAARFSLTPSQ